MATNGMKTSHSVRNTRTTSNTQTFYVPWKFIKYVRYDDNDVGTFLYIGLFQWEYINDCKKSITVLMTLYLFTFRSVFNIFIKI